MGNWKIVNRANTLLNCPQLLNRPRVVQTLDSAIQWIRVRQTKCLTYWTEIYPVDRAIYHFEQLRPRPSCSKGGERYQSDKSVFRGKHNWFS